jgi:hypothetical protein
MTGGCTPRQILTGAPRSLLFRADNALFIFRRAALAPGNGLPQDELDLRIHAAQIVSCPFLDFLPQLRRDSEQKGFALFRRHGQV